ncbi:cation channel sperm-associated auxiliary subunit zeta isoform X1 [Sorex araneus]|uniref:cation channel sperm-associated auxiliary subunit zeta isoform X1 n=1 Tax=Sorex araneus TaxID=42254 RepID=UPI002433D047|nr:cation channel sperm-associated auxiliary subunit zeta isoform X1 [Sorex araneus]
MSSGQDIRDLWTKATLSQVDGSVSLNIVYEDIESQSSYSSSRSEALWSRSKESLMHIWKRPDSEEDNVSLKKSDTFLDKLSVGRLSDRDMPTYRKISSSLLTGVHKYAPHKPYWMEQHTRLPLPLVELMENEVLEILTKALKSEPLPVLPQGAPGNFADGGWSLHTHPLREWSFRMLPALPVLAYSICQKTVISLTIETLLVPAQANR